MKYENAKDVLPARLLEEVQKYAEGKVIYVPRTEKDRGWGEASGYRDKLKKRNALICSRYSSGQSILEIAEEFFLSPETIKKLVYGKKMDLPKFMPSIVSAEQYAAAGMGEEWVRMFLNLSKNPMPDTEEYFMSELVRIPLRLIDARNPVGITDVGDPERITGGSHPGDAPEADQDYQEVPLIVFYDQGHFCVPFQQSQLACLEREKRNAHPAFIFAKNEDYGYFWNHYGKHFSK